MHLLKPVVALSVEQRLGVTVKRLDWAAFVKPLLRFVQGHKEGCLLNGIQRLLVLATAEVGVAALCPWRPAQR